LFDVVVGFADSDIEPSFEEDEFDFCCFHEGTELLGDGDGCELLEEKEEDCEDEEVEVFAFHDGTLF